jgi:uncharacterized protein (DUF433 family)
LVLGGRFPNAATTANAERYASPFESSYLDKTSLSLSLLKLFIMDGRVINIDPEILGGTPVFFGTRVPIKNLFDYLETGDSIETFLDDFEGVKKEQVIKVLEMSQKLIETSTEILNENFA